jgi:excisionase family DNA binding protein
MQTTRRLLTVNEAAERLAVHPITIRRWMRDGRLPALQLGGRGAPVRVDPKALEQFIHAPGEERIA